MDRYEMEQLLTEIADASESGAIAVEDGNKPYITFASPYSAPAAWAQLGKWSQRFYPIGEDRVDIAEQFTDWLNSLKPRDTLESRASVQDVADLYQVSRQSINTRASRLRVQRGSFGQRVAGGIWVFTPEEVEELRPGPSGRPAKEAGQE